MDPGDKDGDGDGDGDGDTEDCVTYVCAKGKIKTVPETITTRTEAACCRDPPDQTWGGTARTLAAEDMLAGACSGAGGEDAAEEMPDETSTSRAWGLCIESSSMVLSGIAESDLHTASTIRIVAIGRTLTVMSKTSADPALPM